ncbi:MAG: DUF1772 domain-containing protein [Acidobacteria bacterium]|nr:MAG: DUF1772 domain-containing protein [Acidobacteriota bacterium]
MAVDAVVTLMAVLACGAFAGAAVYVTLVEHPARMSCSTEVAAQQWAPSYKRATVMQASLAILSAVAGAARWMQTHDWRWLWGAVAILAVVPFTLLVIYPTNQELLQTGRDLGSAETRQLLETWGRRHAVRSGLGLIAFVLFIWAAIR